jgi:uncharacterized protein YgiM (DUF1202 family)
MAKRDPDRGFLVALVLLGIGGVILITQHEKLTSNDTSAQRRAVETERKYATTTVNVRAGPSTSSEIIGQLERRDDIVVAPDSSTDEWVARYSLSGDSVSGWVSSPYISSVYPHSPDDSDDGTATTTFREEPRQSNWDSSVQTVEDYLMSHLNDASTYEAVEWYKMTRVRYDGQMVWGVRHKYRAANKFGAKILKDQVFFMEEKGKVIGVVEYETLR